MELFGVSPHRRRSRSELQADLDVGGAQRIAGDVEGGLDDVAQIDGAPLRRALARHREEGLHDPRAAVGGVADLGGTLDDAWIAGSLLHEDRKSTRLNSSH